MEILLSKTFFEPGEAIEGTVIMELKEPVVSEGVFVSISSQETRPTYTRGRQSTQRYTHYWVRQPLDVAKEYPAGQKLEYHFSIVAPSLRGLPSPLSMLRRFVTKDNTPPVKNFKVEAKLEIGHGLDVNADRDIMIPYVSTTSGNI